MAAHFDFTSFSAWPFFKFLAATFFTPGVFWLGLIISHVKGTRNNRIMKFYNYSVSLYDTAVEKLNRRGLSNTAGRPAKEESSNAALAKNGLPGSTITSQNVSIIKVNEQMLATHLKEG